MTTAAKFDATLFEKFLAADSTLIEIGKATINGLSVHVTASWFPPCFNPIGDDWYTMCTAGLLRVFVTDRPFVGGGPDRTPCLSEEVSALECPSIAAVNLKKLARDYVNKPSHRLVMDRPRTEEGRLALITAALQSALA